MTEDHWLRMRDTGYLDEEGFLTLTGRSCDLVKLVDDDQVNVTPMEQRVRLELACVAQCVIVPNTVRDKLGVILTLDTIADTNNSLCLSQSAVNWFKNARFDMKTVSDVVSNMESGIKHVIQVSSRKYFCLVKYFPSLKLFLCLLVVLFNSRLCWTRSRELSLSPVSARTTHLKHNLSGGD